MEDILKKLRIEDKNYGANFSNWWSNTESEGSIESYCPNDGKLLGLAKIKSLTLNPNKKKAIYASSKLTGK